MSRVRTVAEYLELMGPVLLAGVFHSVEEEWENGLKEVFTTGPKTGFVLKWSCQEIGFGELTVYNEAGRLKCDDEGMSKAFVEAALIKFSRELELTHL